MFSLLDGTADLTDFLNVISAICIILFFAIPRKRVRIITSIIWILTIILDPYFIMYKIGGVIVFGVPTLFIRWIIRKNRADT